MQCVAGVTDFAVHRLKNELLPKFPNVDDVVALDHTYGCGVAIDALDAIAPICTLRNISLNPNFSGEVWLMLDAASGGKKIWAEHWRLYNAMVLFNPASVT